MKILVIGANGLLGTTLTKVLCSNPEFTVVKASRTNEVSVDISSYDSVLTVIKKVQPEFVINLAALTNVDECESNPFEAYKMNALGCKNLAEAQSQYPFKIIHISTDHFYTDSGESDEESVHPLNYYAYSKLMGEAFLGKNALILRTNFFGKTEANKKSFTDWIYDSLNEKKKINLFEDSFFSPLNIDQLSEIILFTIKNYRSGIYNLGSRQGLSKYDFGMMFAKECRLDCSLINKALTSSVSLKAQRPVDMRMSVQKFEKSFTYSLPTLESLILSEVKKYI